VNPGDRCARGAGFDGYLTKPIDARELQEVVARFVGGEGSGAASRSRHASAAVTPG
jgi:CheY-like chemotaxis protein